jgi:hypothetical protein
MPRKRPTCCSRRGVEMRRQNVDDGWVILDELLKPAFAIFARKFLGYGAAIRIEARFHYLPAHLLKVFQNANVL